MPQAYGGLWGVASPRFRRFAGCFAAEKPTKAPPRWGVLGAPPKTPRLNSAVGLLVVQPFTEGFPSPFPFPLPREGEREGLNLGATHVLIHRRQCSRCRLSRPSSSVNGKVHEQVRH